MIPLLEASKAEAAASAGIRPEQFEAALVLADTNYFSEKNCAYLLGESPHEGVIPDPQFRHRGPEADGRSRERKPLEDYKQIPISLFSYDAESDCVICPEGKRLARYKNSTTKRNRGVAYRALESDCTSCPRAGKCLSKGAKRRNIFLATGRREGAEETSCERMSARVDTPFGREQYGYRMGTVEPVFANIAAAKGMNRFTLRGLKKVSGQWLLYCIVHNIGKILTTGAIFRLAVSS